MARLRYLAVLSNRPREIAAFYQNHLQLELLGESDSGDISLTDGFFNLTFLKNRDALNEPRPILGLHHVGFEVEDLESAERRYKAVHPRGVVVKEPGGPHFGELRFYDPEGNAVSLSTNGFGVGSRPRGFPRIGHVAYNALDPEGILQFLTAVFGVREVTTSHVFRDRQRLNRFAGDGSVNIAIHPFYNDTEGHEARFGINHFGFLVNDVRDRLADLRRVISLAPRPDTRPFAEYRLRDPENNAFDLSQTKGWEVDVDVWDRAPDLQPAAVAR